MVRKGSLDVDKEVDGWNRNLGRSIKVVVRDYGLRAARQGGRAAQRFEIEWKKANEPWV